MFRAIVAALWLLGVALSTAAMFFEAAEKPCGCPAGFCACPHQHEAMACHLGQGDENLSFDGCDSEKTQFSANRFALPAPVRTVHHRVGGPAVTAPSIQRLAGYVRVLTPPPRTA